MKILLDSKYVMDMNTLDQITEVVRLGNYSSKKYKVIGEPSDVNFIREGDVVHGKEAEQWQDKENKKELEKTKKELTAVQLRTYRFEAVERILVCSPGLSRKNVTAWTKSETSAYNLQYHGADVVRKWIKEQPKTEVAK